MYLKSSHTRLRTLATRKFVSLTTIDRPKHEPIHIASRGTVTSKK